MATTRPDSTPAAHPETRLTRRAARVALGLAVVASAALSACGSSTPSGGGVSGLSTNPPAPASAPAPAANQITLTDYKVAVPSTMKTGSATFTITNNGAVEHELLVFKSDLDPAQYPYDTSLAKFNEAGPGITSVSDGDNLAAGASQSRTVELTAPGRYLFVCNLPAHFRQGMFTVVTVTG